MIALLLACVSTLEGTYTPPSFSDPTITDFTIECVRRRSLDLHLQPMHGQEMLDWLQDEQGSEEHPLISKGAPRDGSADNLEIELAIVGDWRDAKRGKSTRWSCAQEEELSMIVEVYHPKTYEQPTVLLLDLNGQEKNLPQSVIHLWE